MTVFNPFAPLTRHRLRRLVLWLLACVLPLQGMTAAAFTMLGPAHTHVAAPAPIRLVDFRRQVHGSAQDGHAHTHVATALGHVHASPEAQRHWHAQGDPSQLVEPDDAAALQRLNSDDGRSLSASLATVLAWVPADVAWPTGTVSAQRASSALWAPSHGAVERLERPPRRA